MSQRMAMICHRSFLLYSTAILLLLLADCIVCQTMNIIGLDDCPAVGTQQYRTLEWKHCNSKERLHCQEKDDSKVISFCSAPIWCGEGTYAKLGASKKIICESCPDGYYQPSEKESFEFTTTKCFRRHTRVNCDEEGMVLCKAGTTKTDNRCTCDYKQGFAPSSENCNCFTFNDPCYCYEKDCGEGKQLNQSFHCVHIPTTPTTTTTTTTTKRTTTSIPVLPSDKQHRISRLPIEVIAGASLAVFVAAAMVVLIGIYFWNRKIIKQCCGDKTQKASRREAIAIVTPETTPTEDETLVRNHGNEPNQRVVNTYNYNYNIVGAENVQTGDNAVISTNDQIYHINNQTSDQHTQIWTLIEDNTEDECLISTHSGDQTFLKCPISTKQPPTFGGKCV